MTYIGNLSPVAKGIPILDSDNYYSSANIEDALKEIYELVGTVTGGLDWQPSVLDKDLNTPPGGESGGERYIVAAGGAGAWTGEDGHIAQYDADESAYDFMIPSEGTCVWVEDENVIYVWNGASWARLGSVVDHGTLGGLGDQVDHAWALTLDGSRALTANWDAGSYEIRAQTFQSDIATGTAPLIIASTTKVSNLNVDQVDGYDLDQDVQSTASPTFAGLTLNGDETIDGRLYFVNATGTDPYLYTSANPGAAILYCSGALYVSSIVELFYSLTIVNPGGGDSPYLTSNSATQDLQLTGNFITTGTLTADGIFPEADLADSLGSSSLTWQYLYVQYIKDAGGNTIISNDGSGNIDGLATISDGIVCTHSQSRMLDLNPASTGDSYIIEIIPSASLNAGSTWYGIRQSLYNLDPATGANCVIYGNTVSFLGLASVDGDASLIGYMVDGSASEYEIDFLSYGFGRTVAGNNWCSFLSIFAVPIGVTASCQGLWIDWDNITRTANAPVLQGIRIELPADYTNFGANYAGYFSGDGRTVTICETTYALLTTGSLMFNSADYIYADIDVSFYIRDAGDSDATLLDFNTNARNFALGTTSDNVTLTLVGLLDINPNATTSQNIMDITPSASLAAGSTWRGIYQVLTALDPATGAASKIYGVEVSLAGISSVDHDAEVQAFRVAGNETEDNSGLAVYPAEMTQNKHHWGYINYMTHALSTTATYRGVHIDWDGVTRDANAPVLEGLRIELPASYANFGTSFTAYFSGDGRSVYICDTTYALDVSGAMNLVGAITGVTSFGLSGAIATPTTITTSSDITCGGDLIVSGNDITCGKVIIDGDAAASRQVTIWDRDGDADSYIGIFFDKADSDGLRLFSWKDGAYTTKPLYLWDSANYQPALYNNFPDNVTFGGDLTVSGAIKNAADNSGVYSGADDDIRMHHTGSHGYVSTSVGSMNLVGTTHISLTTGAGRDMYFICGDDFIWRDVDAGSAVRMTLASGTGNLTITGSLAIGNGTVESGIAALQWSTTAGTLMGLAGSYLIPFSDHLLDLGQAAAAWDVVYRQSEVTTSFIGSFENPIDLVKEIAWDNDGHLIHTTLPEEIRKMRFNSMNDAKNISGSFTGRMIKKGNAKEKYEFISKEHYDVDGLSMLILQALQESLKKIEALEKIIKKE